MMLLSHIWTTRQLLQLQFNACILPYFGACCHWWHKCLLPYSTACVATSKHRAHMRPWKTLNPKLQALSIKTTDYGHFYVAVSVSVSIFWYHSFCVFQFGRGGERDRGGDGGSGQPNSRTLAPSDDRHTTWLATDAEYDWPLDPRNEEVGPLSWHSLQHSSKAVKDHCPLSTVNCGTESGQQDIHKISVSCIANTKANRHNTHCCTTCHGISGLPWPQSSTHLLTIVGASLSKPHIDVLYVSRCLSICLYAYV